MVTQAKQSALAAKAAQSEGGSLIRNQKLKQLYLAMLQCRALLHRSHLLNGRGTAKTHSLACYEATEVGCAIDLRAHDAVAFPREDWLTALLRISPVPTDLGGRRRNVLELRERFAEQLIAGAETRKNPRGVVVAFADETEPSSDSWKEALTIAGKRNLPILFVQRSRLAEKPGKGKTRNAHRLPSRSFPSIPVDGHDVVAVYRVAFEAIQRARRGGGPTLIECERYVLEADSLRSRNGAAVGPSQPKSAAGETGVIDPVRQMEQYLLRKRLFQLSWKDCQLRGFARKLDEAFGSMPPGDTNWQHLEEATRSSV